MSEIRFLVRILGLSLVICISSISVGDETAEWPCWRGPNRDGKSPDTSLLKEWPEAGPPQIWKVPTATGFSSFAVAGGRVFTLVRREIGGESREVCVALDADTGRELWMVDLAPARYDRGGDNRRSVLAHELAHPVGDAGWSGLHRFVVQVAQDVRSDGCGRGVAPLALLLQALYHDPVEVTSQTAYQGTGLRSAVSCRKAWPLLWWETAQFRAGLRRFLIADDVLHLRENGVPQ